MEAPSPEVRSQVRERAGESEQHAVNALGVVVEALQGQVWQLEAGADLSEEEAAELLDVVQAWASLASYALARTYAPQSPMPHAGFSPDVARWVGSIVRLLSRPMRRLARRLGSPIWSISVTFPWGLSVSVAWTL